MQIIIKESRPLLMYVRNNGNRDRAKTRKLHIYLLRFIVNSYSINKFNEKIKKLTGLPYKLIKHVKSYVIEKWYFLRNYSLYLHKVKHLEYYGLPLKEINLSEIAKEYEVNSKDIMPDLMGKFKINEESIANYPLMSLSEYDRVISHVVNKSKASARGIAYTKLRFAQDSLGMTLLDIETYLKSQGVQAVSRVMPIIKNDLHAYNIALGHFSRRSCNLASRAGNKNNVTLTRNRDGTYDSIFVPLDTVEALNVEDERWSACDSLREVVESKSNNLRGSERKAFNVNIGLLTGGYEAKSWLKRSSNDERFNTLLEEPNEDSYRSFIKEVNKEFGLSPKKSDLVLEKVMKSVFSSQYI